MEKEKKKFLMFVGEAVVCDSVTTGVIDSANFYPISVKKLFIVLQIAIGSSTVPLSDSSLAGTKPPFHRQYIAPQKL